MDKTYKKIFIITALIISLCEAFALGLIIRPFSILGAIVVAIVLFFVPNFLLLRFFYGICKAIAGIIFYFIEPFLPDREKQNTASPEYDKYHSHNYTEDYLEHEDASTKILVARKGDYIGTLTKIDRKQIAEEYLAEQG